MLVNRADVLKFIPQRDPVVVVHGLVSHSKESSTSEFLVESDHLFTRENTFLEAGLMENIAQTVALHSGYGFSLTAGSGGNSTPPIGFIASLKKFTIHHLPKVGEVLQTTVTMMHEVMEMLVVQGSVSVDGRLMAECEMIVSLGAKNENGATG